MCNGRPLSASASQQWQVKFFLGRRMTEKGLRRNQLDWVAVFSAQQTATTVNTWVL